LDRVVDLVHAVVGNRDLLSAQLKIRHMAVQESNNNENYICWMSHWNVQNQSCLLLVSLSTVKDCRKVVHELYAPKVMRQEFLFVAMTCAVGSLAYKLVMRIGNSQPWVCAHHMLHFLILWIFSPYYNIL